MRAMILAAGRGQRMQSLTDDLPKALLPVHGKYLIEYSLAALRKIAIRDVVINISYHADKIKKALGDGSRYGMNIIYSYEPEALETGGGIFNALPLLEPEPFIVLSCDVITDYDLAQLPREPEKLAHLVLVENPVYHPAGDFCLDQQNICFGEKNTLTFANIGVYRPELFAECQPGKFRLGDVLKKAIRNHAVTGEKLIGFWQNLGTPQQLSSLLTLPDSLLHT